MCDYIGNFIYSLVIIATGGVKMEFLLNTFQQILCLFSQITFLNIFIAIIITIIIYELNKYLVKWVEVKNVPLSMVLIILNKLFELFEKFIPNLNFTSNTKNILQLILESSEIAVKYSEQMYLSGQIQKDERKDKAIEVVETTLTDANIKINEERKELINATIESTVYNLPKKN
jgi:hypothetical protein